MSPATLAVELVNNILACLSPIDLIKFGRTSRAHKQAVEDYIRRTFRINRVLKRYFTAIEIGYFRYLQSQFQIFISGSTAVQFFNHTTYPDSDLDIYVEHRYRETIALWLVSIGYNFRPKTGVPPILDNQKLLGEMKKKWEPDHSDVSPSQPFFESISSGYFGRGIANVYNFVRGGPSSERKIQLITSSHSPLEVILNFHSTCVMNLITHDKAYALYPKATFEEWRSLMYSTEGMKQDTAREKYKNRGWSMVERLTVEEFNDRGSAFAPGNRYVGDSRCWTIPLASPPGMDLPEGFIESNTWALKYDADLIPIMYFRVLLTDCLRYSYLVVDEELARYILPMIYPTEEWKMNLDQNILNLIRWQRTIHNY